MKGMRCYPLQPTAWDQAVRQATRALLSMPR